ncbi:non-specific lipid transfer protein GPI-anchored 1 isoform X1 [Silene latifolia]|uniref:non-specific lipid transfer protein GPI-anchored 1 isoform X1 n=1 Tax=Silene latifolia TaxID=37657 RepID=UPI003D778B5F
MGSQILTAKLVLLTLCLQGLVYMDSGEAAESPSLAVQCGTAIQQVTSCLTFATGKAAEPTKDCCTAVSSMKEKQPVCLCFFIGQAHNGSEQIKSLGIQEAKLMELPSACHLTNASIAECPKLLGISPTSPAAAIFMHNNITSPTPAAPLSSSSTTTSGDNSNGFKHGYGVIAGGFVAVIVSALLCAPTAGNSNFLL